jgi:hypothetical protein
LNVRERVDVFEEAAVFASRVLKPQGVMVIFAPQDVIADAIRLASPFLTFVWVLAVELPKALKVGSRKVTSGWEPALVFVKGDSLGGGISDTITQYVGDEQVATTLQILDMFTLNAEMVVDPYMDEGEVVLTCIANGRNVVGIGATKDEVIYVQRRIAEQEQELAAASAEPEPEEGEEATEAEAESAPGELEQPNEADATPAKKGGKKSGGKGAKRTVDTSAEFQQ